ncbi:hypothetical protein LEP3755_58670 [Leptolyngbya sp. NIES-3755]|nr:hypothetical protein LEP3755_58670 [Leptolyngbya sp. NIES-3755]
MMHGVVSSSCEATISLVVSNTNRQTQLIDTVIDTGYTGFLSLPREIIVALNLPWTVSIVEHWVMVAKSLLKCMPQLSSGTGNIETSLSMKRRLIR